MSIAPTEEIQARRRQLELAIATYIEGFEELTGMEVYTISVASMSIKPRKVSVSVVLPKEPERKTEAASV